MADHPQNPTLLIGLGPFGRAVAHEVEHHARGEEPPLTDGLLLNGDADKQRVQNLETIAVALGNEDDAPWGALHLPDAADEAVEQLRAEASLRSRWLLDLAHFLETTAPTDSRGPRLDIFVVADLSEPGVAELLPAIVGRLSRALREEFRPILRGGDGALAVCPLLALPRELGDRRKIAAALAALDKLTTLDDVAHRPQARMYVVEDQSGKYVLSRAELAHSFAAFLHLLLFSKLRDAEGVRDLVERMEKAPGGPFATFACATLEVDMAALHRYCSVKLAREILDQFKTGTSPVLTEIAGEAHPLVPDPLSLEEQLWKEGVTGTLEDHLQPPVLPVPEIHRMDSPEDIVEHKFGALWQAKISRTMAQFRDEVERFRMDRLAQEIERNGTALVDATARDIMKRVHKDVEHTPRGHARALEFVRYAATHAAGRADAAEAQIASPDLPNFPPPPLERGVAAIQEAAFNRPRYAPYRMRLFGALGVTLSALLWMGVFNALLHFTGYSQLPAFLPWLAGAVFGLGYIPYLLYAHRRRHHNWVVEARHRLDQSLKRYIRTDVVDYFRRRLNYTRLLWVYRIYRRIADRLAKLVEQLEGARAALADADRRLATTEAELLEELGATARGGILFRGLLLPDTAEATYRAARPPDLGALAEQFMAECMEDANTNVLEAPFADPDRLLAFSMEQLAPIADTSPFEPGPTPLSGAVVKGVRAFLTQLAMKLSEPLELIESLAHETDVATGFAIVPPEASKLVSSTLADENLGRRWDVRALSHDPCRVHLLLERGDLPLEALAFSKPPAEEARP